MYVLASFVWCFFEFDLGITIYVPIFYSLLRVHILVLQLNV